MNLIPILEDALARERLAVADCQSTLAHQRAAITKHEEGIVLAREWVARYEVRLAEAEARVAALAEHIRTVGGGE